MRENLASKRRKCLKNICESRRVPNESKSWSSRRETSIPCGCVQFRFYFCLTLLQVNNMSEIADSEKSWRLRRDSLMKPIFISSFGVKKKSLNWSHKRALLTRTTRDALFLWPSLDLRFVVQQEICVSLNLFQLVMQHCWLNHSFFHCVMFLLMTEAVPLSS